MESQHVSSNKIIERAQIIVNAILKHLDNEGRCEHCKSLIEEVFEDW